MVGVIINTKSAIAEVLDKAWGNHRNKKYAKCAQLVLFMGASNSHKDL